MRIEIEKVEYTFYKGVDLTHYKANLKDLPGAPVIGDGPTPEFAVANLFFKLLSDNIGWVRYVDFSFLQVVKDE